MIPTVCVLATLNYGLAAQCQYVPMPDRYVAILTADAMRLGQLTAEGAFKERTRIPSRDGMTLYSGPPFTLLNGSGVHGWLMYELRGKSLVPGRMSEDGVFVVDKSEKAIPFDEYEFSPTARPIWNLPGRFLPLGIDPDKQPAVPLSKSGAQGLMSAFNREPAVPMTHGGFGSVPPGVTRGGFGGGRTYPPASVGGGGSRGATRR
jgi:hypothetical protein